MRVSAAVREEKSGVFRLDNFELDAPRSDEVLVEISATGICHTDLRARDGNFQMPYPAVERAGVVAAFGSAVEYLAVGDHVVISFPWCGECENCREDRRSYCRRGSELKSSGRRADRSITMRRNGASVYGSFFQQFSFATHALTPARNAIRVQRDAPLEFLGPLGCGVQTGAGAVLNVMKPEAGKSFAVFGAGAVGLAGLMAAKLIPHLIDLFFAGRFPTPPRRVLRLRRDQSGGNGGGQRLDGQAGAANAPMMPTMEEAMARKSYIIA
jgi:aryl-alcohol dehydrogenase